MGRFATALAVLATVSAFPGPANADVILFHGKVTMADGAPPTRSAGIEYVCPGRLRQVVAITGKSGAYLWKYQGTAFDSAMASNDGLAAAGGGAAILSDPSAMAFIGGTSYGTGCGLRAAISGFVSSTIDLSDHQLARNPQLPDLVLTRPSANEGLQIDSSATVPRAAQKAWDRGLKALQSRNWEQAETQLQAAVAAAPKFALGWNALALACRNQSKTAEARAALERAVELDPKTLSTRFRLMRAEMDAKDWPAAAAAAEALIKADARKRYQQAYLDLAIVRFHLDRLDQAIESAAEEIRLDTTHELPRAEYVLGMLHEAKRDCVATAEHMRRYLQLEPKAGDADAVRARIENLGKPTATDVAASLDASDVQLAPAGETWVPGGIQALAAMAGLKETASYATFFEDFCQAMAAQAAPEDGQVIPQYYASLQAFMSSVVELTALGERRGEAALVTLSLSGDEQRRRAGRILHLLGWRMTQEHGADLVEPGDQPTDGLRQRIPAALGIDAIAMKQALESGRSFQLEVKSENARLIGGAAWGSLLKGNPQAPGELADIFTRDWRFAEAYAALSSMGSDAASAVVAGAGLQAVVTRYSDILWLYSDAIRVSNGSVVTPGGAPAESYWTRLVGADPHVPPAFFRALLDKDRGDLLSFYGLLSRAEAAHQRFFSETPARMERFYAWYRDSGDVRLGKIRTTGAWHASFFHDVPLDDAGHVHFPGGRRAWTESAAADDDALPGVESLAALVPVARIEQNRKVPLDQESAALLVRRYPEWRALFPYFEKLPGLGVREFQALAAFGDAVAKSPQAARSLVLGQWHSMVELIVLGSQAGSLDAAGGAQWFRRACEGLAARDHSAAALGTLREMAGGAADLDEALASGLLRLTGARRSAFDRVRELQQTPRIAFLPPSADPASALAALAGFVYAALLGPQYLLVVEEPGLARRHQFIRRPDAADLFPPSELVVGAGSYFAGGFMRFEEEARRLALTGASGDTASGNLAVASQTAAGQRATGASAEAPVARQRSEALFQANARLVEVYATVTDGGRYVDDLGRDAFKVREGGKDLPLAAFENRASGVSCALLLDTTASMQAALPALKSTALKLIGELRPIDSMAVYSFSDAVTQLQPFTTDKSAAGSAVLRTQAFGKTALYDALVRVGRDLVGRGGKKVIVVFTAGADNTSALSGDTAVRRAKAVGVPVYTIALGDALADRELVKQLASVAKATGGASFTIQSPSEIRAVFESVAQDLMHGYLLAFQPPPGDDHGWRALEVLLRSSGGRKVRAREGYYPD
jgi:VWFA-related protein